MIPADGAIRAAEGPAHLMAPSSQAQPLKSRSAKIGSLRGVRRRNSRKTKAASRREAASVKQA
jgi:hypothetical protein